MKTSHEPPRLAVALLRRAVPSADADAILGDLTEVFADRVDAGRAFPRAWFWTQALLLAAFRRRGVRHGRAPRPSTVGGWFSLRSALRMLRHDPGYALAFVVTLGLGIGATTAIFSVVEGVLIRPLPYPHADRIMYMEQSLTPGSSRKTAFSFVEVADYRQQARTIDEFVEYGDWQFMMVGADEPRIVYGGLVTSNYFKVLAIRPLLGRTLDAADDARTAAPVIVLTYEFWRTAFGASPSAVGQVVDLLDTPATIVGVLEPGSHYAGTKRAEIYGNYQTNLHYMSASMQSSRTHRMTDVYALVKAGIPLATARAEMTSISDALHHAYPAAYPASGVTLTPWLEVLVRDARPTLLILMGAVALVLLVACANVGNLTLARLVRRERELAMRTALGASSTHLRSQLLVEHLVLATAGAGLGVAVAATMLRMLVAYTARLTLRADAVNLNGAVLAFSLAVAVAAAVVFALAPRLPSVDNASAAISGSSIGGRTTTSRARRRLQRGLVATQVAMSFVVLVGAGLLTRTFAKLQDVSPGFDPTQVLSLHAPNPSGQGQKGGPDAPNRQLFDRLQDTLRTYPGVVSVATATRAPFDVGEVYPSSVKAERSPLDGTTPPMQMFPQSISPDYFSTLKIRLLRGRAFTSADRTDGLPVAIVNQTMARAAFGTADPIGRHIESDQMARWTDGREIVGLAEDVHEIGGAGGVMPTIYVPASQSTPGTALLIRTTGDPAGVAHEAARLIHAMDPKRPVTDVRTLETAAAEHIAPSRINATLFGGFAALALAIAAVGIGAILAFSVTERTREFGIRMALGSSRAEILGGVLGEGIWIAGVGLVCGGAASVVLSSALRGLLFDVAPLDAVTYSAVGLILLAVAGLAAWVPARRATRVDPCVALRRS